jgi:hypothetical protein
MIKIQCQDEYDNWQFTDGRYPDLESARDRCLILKQFGFTCRVTKDGEPIEFTDVIETVNTKKPRKKKARGKRKDKYFE